MMYKMTAETCTTDMEGRVRLPEAFANSTVVIEHVSEDELRVRKVGTVLEGEVPLREESTLVLSDRDRDRFLEALEHPHEPNARLRRTLAER